MKEQVILSKRNCHRAAQVRLVAAPDNGVYEWSFRAVKVREGFLRNEYEHLAKQSEHEVRVRHIEVELGNWEVVAWKYELSFEYLWAKAVRAFNGTSFSPEERAESYLRQYEATCVEDLKDIPQEEHDSYIQKFKNWVEILFDKHSRIMSTMITGPARFPTARNEKACNSYDKAVNEFTDWREKYAKRIAKQIEASKTPEQRESEEWERLRKNIYACYKICTEIDSGATGYHRTAFTNSIFGKVERLAFNGQSNFVLKALEYIKELQSEMKKPMFTSRHKIWNLQDVCTKAINAKEERENRSSVEITLNGAKIIKNFADNRLQIFHNEKPEAEVIRCLKSNGFKWSRLNGCWQRQLTDNSYYGAARVFFSNDNLSNERQQFINKLRAIR